MPERHRREVALGIASGHEAAADRTVYTRHPRVRVRVRCGHPQRLQCPVSRYAEVSRQTTQAGPGVPAERVRAVSENAGDEGRGVYRPDDVWGGRVDFAQRLTRLFEETRRPDGKRWTLQYVADECVARGQTVTKAYILHLKAGQRTEPRLSLVEALADVFRVPVTYFHADYAGRVTSDLLPLLVAMHDPRLRRLLGRADVADLAVLSEPPLADLVERYGIGGLLARLVDPEVREQLAQAEAASA